MVFTKTAHQYNMHLVNFSYRGENMRLVNRVVWSFLVVLDRFHKWRLLFPYRFSRFLKSVSFYRAFMHQLVSRKTQLEIADFSIHISGFRFIDWPTSITCRGVVNAKTIFDGLACEKEVFGFNVKCKNPKIDKCFSRPESVFNYIEQKIDEGRFTTGNVSSPQCINLRVEAERDFFSMLKDSE